MSFLDKLFSKIFKKYSTKQILTDKAERDDVVFNYKVPEQSEIYYPDNVKAENVEVQIVELTEKQAVELGWSYRKKSKRIRITNYHGTETNLIVPSKIGGIIVNEIGESAFANKKLDSVEIPSSVKKIGAKAFEQSEVVRVIFGEGVRILNDCTFNECKCLKEVHLPNTLIEIGKMAFRGCKSLEYIIIPSSIYRPVGEMAFFASGLRGFSSVRKYCFHNGNIFAETPIHKNYKLLIMQNNFEDYKNILLVGQGAEIKFWKNSIIHLEKNSVLSDCSLDFSDCRRVDVDKGAYNVHSQYYSRKTSKAVVLFNTSGLYFPSYVDVRYPDNKRYKGIMEYLEKEGNYKYIKVKINGSWIPPYFMRTGAEQICIDNGFCSVEAYGFNEIKLKSIEFSGHIGAAGEIFTSDCTELQSVKWIEKGVTVEKFITPTKLIGEPLHTKLLQAFTDKYNFATYSYDFYRGEVIDRIFTEGRIEYKDYYYNKVMKLNQKIKILLAIDVLRSTKRQIDPDTKIYSEYLRTHRRYAEIVCERIEDEFPEYNKFLQEEMHK